jgi:hypothetical protein
MCPKIDKVERIDGDTKDISIWKKKVLYNVGGRVKEFYE